MGRQKGLLALFLLIAVVQLYVPAKMILDREDILTSGVEHKFKTAPIDPNDPFRGKYIQLRFDQNSVEIEEEDDWISGESIFVSLTRDSSGFTKIESVSKQPIAQDQPFLKAKVDYVTSDGSNRLFVQYPFDRYYMEESKAPAAELAYQDSQADTSQIAYALVNIKEGKFVLKDVMIDGVPIKELVDGGANEYMNK